MRYLTMMEILEVAKGHVGTYHLLDENRLHYLVEAVVGKFGDTELYPTLSQKAAVYAHHIITGHIFFDGNKRIGLNCAILFLEFNGCTLRLDIDDSIIDLGFKIADGTITDIAVGPNPNLSSQIPFYDYFVFRFLTVLVRKSRPRDCSYGRTKYS